MDIKKSISRYTAGNCKLDKTLLQLKRSWDEVYKFLQRTDKSGKCR